MSLRTPELQVEIAGTNMNLPPFAMPGTGPALGSNLRSMSPYLAETGYTNLEIHPTRAIIGDVERGTTPSTRQVIGSFHQTYNGGTDLFGWVADLSGLRRVHESVGDIERLQPSLGRSALAVMYIDNLPPGFGPRQGVLAITQPQQHTAHSLGIHTTEDWIRLARERNLIGLCPDATHDRIQYPGGPNDNDGMLERWASRFASGRAFEGHIGLNRGDMTSRDAEIAERSIQEGEAFASKHWHDAHETQLGQMIVAAIESWVEPTELVEERRIHNIGRPVLRMVIEMPAAVAGAAALPAFLGRTTLLHARAVDNFAEVVRQAGAEPVLWQKAA